MSCSKVYFLIFSEASGHFFKIKSNIVTIIYYEKNFNNSFLCMSCQKEINRPLESFLNYDKT